MLKLSRTKHIKICDNILTHSDNYAHFWFDVIPVLFSYGKKHKLKKSEIIFYNSLKYQNVLSLFCVSRPLENAPVDVEVLEERTGVNIIIPCCKRLSYSGINEKKILYLIRDKNNTKRNITNSDDCLNALIDTFKEHEIMPISFENMSLEDQINCVKDCKLLIGAHGAGLVNSLFMQPNTCLIELFPSSFVNDLFKHLCSLKKINYDRLHGFSVPESEITLEEFIQKNNTINPEDGVNLRHAVRDVNFSVDVDCLIEKCKNILKNK
jgi:hypothetical protein